MIISAVKARPRRKGSAGGGVGELLLEDSGLGLRSAERLLDILV